MKCEKCGFDNSKENIFCEKCGAVLSSEKTKKTETEKEETKEEKPFGAFRVVSVLLIVALLCTSFVFFIQWKDTERFLINERAKNKSVEQNSSETSSSQSNGRATAGSQNNLPSIGEEIRLTTANYKKYCSIVGLKNDYNQMIGLEIKGASNFYSFCGVGLEISVTVSRNNKLETQKIHIDLDIGGDGNIDLSKSFSNFNYLSSWTVDSVTGTVCRQI